MKDNEIIELLSGFEGINFVGIAVTPWHAHGIDVAIDKLIESGVIPRGYILTIPFPHGARTVFRGNFIYLSEKIKVIECSIDDKSLIEKTINNLIAKNREKKNVNANKVFYVARPSYPDFNWINIISKAFKNTRVCFISTDEGCGSYIIDNDSNWVAAISDTQKRRRGLFYKAKVILLKMVANKRIAFRKTFENKLVADSALLIWRLLKTNSEGEVYLDVEMAERYKKVFLSTNSDGISNDDIDAFNDAIIINMAPSFEEGTNVKDADLKVLDIIMPLLEDYKDKVIIKTHPRETNPERYKQYGAIIRHVNDVSQELLISRCRVMPRCVISIDSTTLITLRSIYGIPAIGLTKLYMNFVEDRSIFASAKKFVEVFNNIVDFPNNEDEVNTLLKDILTKSTVEIADND